MAWRDMRGVAGAVCVAWQVLIGVADMRGVPCAWQVPIERGVTFSFSSVLLALQPTKIGLALKRIKAMSPVHRIGAGWQRGGAMCPSMTFALHHAYFRSPFVQILSNQQQPTHYS